MIRGGSQNQNYQRSRGQKRQLRRVDGIFVPVKRAQHPTLSPQSFRGQKTVQKPVAQKPFPPKTHLQPVKTQPVQPQPDQSKPAQAPTLSQPPTFSQPKERSYPSRYQFEPVKLQESFPQKEEKEASFFEIPLAQEYEKDWLEKSAIYKRVSLISAFAVVIFSLIFSGWFLFKEKNTIQKEVYASSEAGRTSLLAAQDFLLAWDFENAEKKFLEAYQDFGKIEKELSSLGQANVLVSRIPNNDLVITQGERLIAAAKNISFAGSEVTSCASLFEGFDILSRDKIDSWHSFNLAAERLLRADNALEQAQKNLAYVSPKVLPEVADLISGLKESLPSFRQTLSLLRSITNEGPAILGKDKKQDYLILFQNPAEARATGGFLGNYGYLSFSEGKLKGPHVHDIYKFAWTTIGKRDIIKPPEEVFEANIGLWQKARWELWDANWDIDFPTAAKKLQWYYEQYDQGLVEGVIAIDPLVFADILKIIGPIKMSKYGVTVRANNFWQVMERKVEVDNPFKRGEAEYKDANPKQILKDFAPLLMNKIENATDEQKQAVVQSIYENLKKKHLLLFANNHNLQEFFEKLNWSGKVMPTSGDYLYINESNVGINKSSSRIRQSFDLKVDIKEDKIQNHLKITRKHQGSPKNPLTGRNIAYLRILVPKGATLNSFLVDGKDAAHRVLLLEESGKTKFGVLTRVEPQKTQAIEITYTLPFKIQPTSITPKSYSLYFQKQPGKIDEQLNVNVNFDSGFKVKSFQSELGGNFSESTIDFISDLSQDRIFQVLLSK